MSYEYDAFISYKSGKVYGRWVQESFFEFFKEFLDQSLGRETKVFIDKSNIYDGEAWQEKLKSALAKSKCLVAILSPLYFQSEWCKRECSVMLHREEQLGYRSVKKPQGLISAIALHDGDRFPRIIQEIQYRIWHDYALVGKGFEKTETFIEFQKELKTYADNVARIIESAPPFQDKWLEEEWLESSYGKYPLDLTDGSFGQPTL